MRPSIERARAALDRGRPEEALVARLEAWRESRAVELADAIDRVSARIRRERQLGVGG